MPTPEERPVQANHLVQYKQQANPLLSMHNYTLLVNVIRMNDKNKQLTLLGQCKPILTEINTLFALYPLEHLKNLKNDPVLYSGLKLITVYMSSKAKPIS